MEALWRLSDGDPARGVAEADIGDAIGRGHGDMRTALNLESLRGEQLAAKSSDGSWSLTEQGVAWLKQDRELSDR
jgi:hypothetical protein